MENETSQLNKEEKPNIQQNEWERYRMQHKHNNGLAGLVIIIVGIVLLLSRLPQTKLFFPTWLFQWPMILIVVGLFVGAKHNFKSGFGWLVPIFIGVYFLLTDGDLIGANMRIYALPLFLILLGIILIINRNKRRCYKRDFYRQQYRHHHRGRYVPEYEYQDKEAAKNEATDDSGKEDFLEINSIFGGSEKTMFTKTFKGGSINCAFGAGKVNLMHADMESKAILNVSVAFGGAEIIVPSNWNIQNELSAFMGGIEDKRRIIATDNPDKTLILRGSIFCGGVEIKNY